MTGFFRKLFTPILDIFEQGDGQYSYKPLQRKVLNIIGVLFSCLSIAVVFLAPGESGYGFLFPVIVFLGAGIICLVIGLLGSDRAVARIWGNG